MIKGIMFVAFGCEISYSDIPVSVAWLRDSNSSSDPLASVVYGHCGDFVRDIRQNQCCWGLDVK